MSRKLKIGDYLYPTLGGSGVVATELGKLLAERGHEIHFITHSIPFRLGHYHKNIFYHEVEVNNYYVFRYPPYDLSLPAKWLRSPRCRISIFCMSIMRFLMPCAPISPSRFLEKD